MTRVLTLLAVLGLLLGACGGDDSSAGDDAAEDAVSETESDGESEPDSDGSYSTEDYAAVVATELQTGGAFPGTEEQISCVSEGFVDAIGGADALNEAGLTPESLGKAEGPDDLGLDLDEEAVADELVTSFDDCDYDLIRMLAESIGQGAPEGFEDCVRAEITNDDVAAVFARLIIDPADQQAADAILPQIEACATPTTGG